MERVMARRPELPETDPDMRRWSSLLEKEVSAWGRVSSRPMFGMLALYRGNSIFAALPRTRAPGTSSSLLVKLPGVAHERLRVASGPGAGWAAFEMDSPADIPEALRWLERAYEKAGTRRRR
jgi:hypothetical protein